MHYKILIIFLILFASVNTAQASDPRPAVIDMVDIMIYRPMGLVATITGSALFVGISPLTALTAISPPHDAFEKTAKFLIINPAKFTFDRPLGVYFPDDKGDYYQTNR